MFLVGAAAGRYAVGPAATSGRVGLAARFAGLPAGERARFRAAMQANAGGLGAARGQLQAAQARVFAQLRAPAFDAAALQAAFTHLETASAEVQRLQHAGLVPALATLSAEARAALAPGRGR